MFFKLTKTEIVTADKQSGKIFSQTWKYNLRLSALYFLWPSGGDGPPLWEIWITVIKDSAFVAYCELFSRSRCCSSQCPALPLYLPIISALLFYVLYCFWPVIQTEVTRCSSANLPGCGSITSMPELLLPYFSWWYVIILHDFGAHSTNYSWSCLFCIWSRLLANIKEDPLFISLHPQTLNISE